LDTPFSLKSLLSDTFVFMDRQLRARGIQVKLEGGEAVYLQGNYTQIESVFHNLISNARDAFPEKSFEEKIISISAGVAREGWMELVFEDNAGGVPKAHIDQIFEPFYTTKEGAHGTGLGLSLSRKIIEEHGGTICCASDAGRTRFTILLPVVPGPA
jgi:signal transduction histidine kinase